MALALVGSACAKKESATSGASSGSAAAALAGSADIAMGSGSAAGSGNADAAGSGSAAAAGSGSDAAGSGSAAATASAGSGVATPKVTPEMLFAAKPKWQVDSAARGLWFRVGKGPLTHTCGAELKKTMTRVGKVRDAAKGMQADGEFMDPTTCEAVSGFAVCTYTHPVADPDSDPGSIASWVFAGSSDKPTLVAVLLGAGGDVAAIAPQLAKAEACPK